MLRNIKKWVLFTSIAGSFLVPVTATAVTLQEALIQAYETNPSLEISRASLRSQDETVVQAGAGKRPSVSVSGLAAYSAGVDSLSDPVGTLRASLDAQLVIFDGGGAQPMP